MATEHRRLTQTTRHSFRYEFMHRHLCFLHTYLNICHPLKFAWTGQYPSFICMNDMQQVSDLEKGEEGPDMGIYL